MPCNGKKNAPTFSFCVIKCVDFWLCHVNMKEKVRKRLCIPQEASQTARFDPLGSLALHGRGGSVSRRDHNQAAGTRAHLTGGTPYAEADTSSPSYSSGGGPGEALLSEKRPPPEFSLFVFSLHSLDKYVKLAHRFLPFLKQSFERWRFGGRLLGRRFLRSGLPRNTFRPY